MVGAGPPSQHLTLLGGRRTASTTAVPQLGRWPKRGFRHTFNAVGDSRRSCYQRGARCCTSAPGAPLHSTRSHLVAAARAGEAQCASTYGISLCCCALHNSGHACWRCRLADLRGRLRCNIGEISLWPCSARLQPFGCDCLARISSRCARAAVTAPRRERTWASRCSPAGQRSDSSMFCRSAHPLQWYTDGQRA